MPKAAILQSGFDTGEISPLCYGLVQNPRYKKGMELAENYIPTLQGPLTRRPATKYMGVNVKDSTKPPYYVPFRFSASQNYMLEFGDQYIRFDTNNAQMVTPGASVKLAGFAANGLASNGLLPFTAARATNAPQANEVIFSSAAVTIGDPLEIASPYLIADVPLIRWAQTGNNLYLFHPKYPVQKLQRQSTQTEWKLSAVPFLDGPYLAANSYLSVGDNVKTILYSPSLGVFPNSNTIYTADIVSITGTSNVGGKIGITTASAHGLGTGERVFITGVTGTTEANNFSNFFGRTSANPQTSWIIDVTGATTFTLLGSTFTNAYAAGGEVHHALFATSAQQVQAGAPAVQDIGRAIALQIGGIRYWGNISTVFDAATVDAIMGGTAATGPVTIPNTNNADLWKLGTYGGGGSGNNFVGNGYPACGAFHQDRLFLSGAAEFPQNVDGSEIGLYESFVGSKASNLQVVDSNALSFTLNSGDQNPIRWMESTAQGLLAGSASCEWALTPSGNSEALSPTNFNAQQSSFFGSALIAPGKLGNAVLYIQNASRKLREITFFFQAGTFRSEDLSELSEHITLPGIKQVAVQKETQPLFWCLRTDGVLLSFLYNRNDVTLSAGWMRQILGGVSDNIGTPAVVHSIGFVPAPDQSFDQMYLIVKRFINGATVYTKEFMTKIQDDSISQADSFYGDCGSTYSGAPATTISGLTWLKGETVGVLADGTNVADHVVSNAGTITLAVAASKVQVGLRYKSRGKLLRPDAGAADGTSIGATRRTTRVAFQMHRQGDFAFGTEFNNLLPVDFAKMDQSDEPIPGALYSGIIRDGVESRYDFNSQVCFQQEDMLPGTIQSITSFLEEFSP